MAREVTSNVVTEINKVSNQPVLLFELKLTNAGYLRFSATKDNITFNGYTWVARAVVIGETEQTAEGQVGTVSVQFDNVDNTMSAYLDDEDFSGNTMAVYRVFRDAVASGDDYVTLFNGYMEEVETVDRRWLTLKATTGKPLRRTAFVKEYTTRCNHKFGDEECNQDGYSDLTTLTVEDAAVDSGSTDYLKGDKTDLGSVDSGTTNFWKYGKIEFWVKGSGTTFVKTITTSSSGTSKLFLDVPMSFAIDNSYTYNVYKGCPKDFNSCISADNGLQNKSGSSIAWGPSQNNFRNFLGFINISQTEETGTLY